MVEWSWGKIMVFYHVIDRSGFNGLDHKDPIYVAFGQLMSFKIILLVKNCFNLLDWTLNHSKFDIQVLIIHLKIPSWLQIFRGPPSSLTFLWPSAPRNSMRARSSAREKPNSWSFRAIVFSLFGHQKLCLTASESSKKDKLEYCCG